jgi:RNA polymerase sigma factor (sigma-70 family)
VQHVVKDHAGDLDATVDLVQEVFLRALEQLPSLRHPDRFRPWLLSIARHAAIDHRRARSRVALLSDDTAERIEADGPGPERLSELQELTELVRGCVAGLSRRDATAVALVSQFGYSIREVAETLGVSDCAAKVLLHRARRRLRDALTLEVLLRRNAGGCPELALAFDQDDLIRAGRHIRSCPSCASLAVAEVTLYGLRVGPHG